MAFLWKKKHFRSAPINGGFWQHVQRVAAAITQFTGGSTKYFSTELISSLWVELCLGINAIYPLLQCQSSSGSVGKSIWPEFRRLKFKSWLDLNFFLRQVILNVICILELWQGFAAVFTSLLKIFTAEYHAILLELHSEAILATIFVWTKLSKMATLLSEFCYF